MNLKYGDRKRKFWCTDCRYRGKKPKRNRRIYIAAEFKILWQ